MRMHLITNTLATRVEIAIGQEVHVIESSSHFELISGLIGLSDEALLVSPFLYEDFSPFFSSMGSRKISFELITSCAPKGSDQLKKPFSLKSFGDICKSISGEWPVIGIDQRLHAKIYVFYREGEPFAGIVTSANLTKSGLSLNHETGFLCTEKTILLAAAEEARRNVQYVNVSEHQVSILCMAADAGACNFPIQEDQNIGIGNILTKYCTPNEGHRDVGLQDFSTYYVKVSGVRDRPILPQDRREISEPHTTLSFAKEPKNIRIGDCLLEVAVGGKCFLSYYSCASRVCSGLMIPDTNLGENTRHREVSDETTSYVFH